MKYIRSKKKPKKGALCDCTIGVHKSKHPCLIGCPNAATVQLDVFNNKFGIPMWVCESCAESILSKQ